MSDEKPALLRIERPQPHGPFAAVFQLPHSAGTVSVAVPSGTAEEHMVEVARDHLHRLMQAVAGATKDWIVPDDRRREIDPTCKRTTAFEHRERGERPARR